MKRFVQFLHLFSDWSALLSFFLGLCVTQKKARQKKEKDTKKAVVQADDLIPFRQFAKKTQTDDNDVSTS